jgi:hypothetical protein
MWRVRKEWKMAQEYIVQEWLDGKAGVWRRLSANGELEAAEQVAGIKLRTVGKLGELRARVRVIGSLKKKRTFTPRHNAL